MSQNSKIPLPCCRLCFPDSKYNKFFQNAPHIKQAGVPQNFGNVKKVEKFIVTKLELEVVDLGSLIPNI